MSDVFKSKRFYTMVVGLISLVLSSIVPELSEHLDVIAPSIVAIVGILIGGYSAQDTAISYKTGTSKYEAKQDQ